jgi:hypothetical protein
MPRYNDLLPPALPRTLRRWLVRFNRLTQFLIIADVTHFACVVVGVSELKNYSVVAAQKPFLRGVQIAQVPLVSATSVAVSSRVQIRNML